eukprot:scaffold458494_cov20-Prasinocladus_malaysianus.AAC.1
MTLELGSTDTRMGRICESLRQTSSFTSDRYEYEYLLAPPRPPPADDDLPYGTQAAALGISSRKSVRVRVRIPIAAGVLVSV